MPHNSCPAHMGQLTTLACIQCDVAVQKCILQRLWKEDSLPRQAQVRRSDTCLAFALQAVFQGSFAVRPLSGAASAQEQAGQKAQQQPRDAGSKGALAAQQEEFDAITDQIPQRPVGIVEGTSYTLLIAAGIALAGAQQQPLDRNPSHACMHASAATGHSPFKQGKALG